MAPRLVPGNVVATGWFPIGDRFRRPGRFECWTVSLADQPPALKRVTGLPGERVSLADGDLVIDGTAAIKGPSALAEVGTVLERLEPAAVVGDSGTESPWRWTWPSREVLDAAAVVETRTRFLLPVHDVGVAAVVRVVRDPAPGGCRIRILVGDLAVPWRLVAAGRHAVVAGRLDGHLVAAAWPLPAGGSSATPGRSCLPEAAPGGWQVAEPWPAKVHDATAADAAPLLAIDFCGGDSAAVLEQLTVWRDVLYLPLDGLPQSQDRPSWRLGTDEYLVLGDFPAESSDSRHWGPMPRKSLRHRVSDR